MATQIFLEFSPRIPAKMIQFDEQHIFQMGWFNHQLALLYIYIQGLFNNPFKGYLLNNQDSIRNKKGFFRGSRGSRNRTPFLWGAKNDAIFVRVYILER